MPHVELPDRLDRHRVGVALALVLLFGAALRIQYALPGLDSRRFWDERYNFENVQKVLETGSFEPASIYYPSPLQTWPQALVVAASQRLHQEHGVEAARIVHPRGWYTPTAYLLVRMVSVVYGTLTLAVLFLIGRRLVSPAFGLLAALGLAALPLHIHVSSMFKPDALLVLCVALAFLLALRAVASARWRDAVLAGIGISLAMSAKVIGGLVALALVVGTVVAGWKNRRRLALLALAAATSLVSFLLLNPYARHYPAYTAHLQGDYARRAELQGLTRLEMPRALIELLAGPHALGPALAALGLVGLAWLAVSVRRPAVLEPVGPLAEERAQRAMLASLPVLYALAYLAGTPYFKSNNLLPIVPFVLLGALWALREIWRRLGRRRPALHRPAVRTVAIAGLIVMVAAPGPVSVYRALVPTTFDGALEFISRAGGPQLGRIVFVERDAEPGTTWTTMTDAPRRGPSLVRVDRLDEVERRRLDLGDGEIALGRRLEGADSAAYRERLERLPATHRLVLEPRLFALRGPPLVALRHPRRLAADPLDVPLERCPPAEEPCYRGPLPESVAPGHLVSFVAVVPWGVVERAGGSPTIEVAERAHPLWEAFRDGWTVTLVTERFRLGERGRGVRLATGRPRDEEKAVEIQVRRWRQAGHRDGRDP